MQKWKCLRNLSGRPTTLEVMTVITILKIANIVTPKWALGAKCKTVRMLKEKDQDIPSSENENNCPLSKEELENCLARWI